MVRRAALSSENGGWRAYPVSIDASLSDGSLAVELTTEVLYSSTCPASVALARQLLQQQFAHDFAAGATLDRAAVIALLGSEQGVVASPHAQRSMAQVRMRLAHDAGLQLLRLLDSVEQALGTPVQTAFKRDDEQAFARANGGNLMFCEDAARRVRHALASANGEGSVGLTAGMGAVVVVIGAAEQSQRVDGWGLWLGTEGSGAWLGHAEAGLRAAARATDCRGPSTGPQVAAQAQFGTVGTLAVRLSADSNPGPVLCGLRTRRCRSGPAGGRRGKTIAA